VDVVGGRGGVRHRHAARDEIAGIEFVVANTMLRAIDRAIQVHGALGRHR
jgi:alkylation response protein AidB-like acyl-CoA dehydrogenase